MLSYRSDPMVGGQGIYMRHLTQALIESGHKVDVVSGDPLPELDPRVGLVYLPGLNLYERGLWNISWRDIRDRTDLLEWISKLTGGFAEPWSFCERAFSWLRTNYHKYDVIHDNQSLGSALLRLSSLGVPILATIHHPITRDLSFSLAHEPRYHRRLLLHRWYYFLHMQQRVARALPRIVTVSHSSRRDVTEDFGLCAERVSVVHNGIDTNCYQPDPNCIRKPNLLMGVSSSEHALKGLKYLLWAFSDLVKRFPDLELLLVGKLRKNGKHARLIRQLGLGQRVRNVSRMTSAKLARCYSEAGIVVIPSLYEGFGFPVGEAMACGAPVVCTDGGALKEIAADAAVVVAAGSSKALVQGIEGLLKDPQRAQCMGAYAHKHILKHFSWHRASERMTAVYRELLGHEDFMPSRLTARSS